MGQTDGRMDARPLHCAYCYGQHKKEPSVTIRSFDVCS